jgi:tetrahydromethanopterin S-methyltransferase subunit G
VLEDLGEQGGWGQRLGRNRTGVEIGVVYHLMVDVGFLLVFIIELILWM